LSYCEQQLTPPPAPPVVVKPAPAQVSKEVPVQQATKVVPRASYVPPKPHVAPQHANNSNNNNNYNKRKAEHISIDEDEDEEPENAIDTQIKSDFKTAKEEVS